MISRVSKSEGAPSGNYISSREVWEIYFFQDSHWFSKMANKKSASFTSNSADFYGQIGKMLANSPSFKWFLNFANRTTHAYVTHKNDECSEVKFQ